MTRTSMSERRTSLLGALLTMIGPVSMSIYTPAMPELVQAFGTTEAAIKVTMSAYFGGFACAQLLAGPVSDALGRRPATLAFLLIYLLGSFAAAFAPAVDWLIAGRLIQGVGASVGITVSRAIVRDQFSGEEAARILNMIGIILTVGPALAPTVGGLALSLAGWQAVFGIMVGFAICASLTIGLFMTETGQPDRELIRPRRLAASYLQLATDWRVLFPALVLAGSVGALYAQATMLPFIMIEQAGLTPAQFGLAMLMQSGFFFLGSVMLRLSSSRLGQRGALVAGFVFLIGGATAVMLSTRLLEPSFFSIMGPVALSSLGVAFVSPHITAAGLAPHPGIAGSASAFLGFIQMGVGFLGGIAAALIGDPLIAFGVVIPGLQVMALCAYTAFRQLERRQG